MKFIFFLILSTYSLFSYSQQHFEFCEEGKNFTYPTTRDIPGTVEWFLNGNSIGVGNDIEINYNEPGDYEIVAIGYNDLGCPGDPVVFNVVVTQCEPLIYWVPNSFTPDGNEYNQTWGAILTNGLSVDEFNLQVYNRWGEIIWETSNPSIQWDGTYNGQIVPNGTYVWQMTINYLKNGGRESVIGHVTIIN